MLVYCFFEPKKPVSIAPAVLCSGLTNEIQCLIVITRKDLALRTKTNQQASSKENRMEVRLVTAASRGFFFLSRVDHDRGFAAHNRSFATKKKPSGTQGILHFDLQPQFKYMIYFIYTSQDMIS